MSSERPFRISIPDDSISLLQQKLQLATFPDELDDAGWEYGAPLADIRPQLNIELPQFTRDVERSEAENAIPLLFVHGWPGSVIEVRKILPLLTLTELPRRTSQFTRVRPRTKKFGIDQYAEVCNKLMLALGDNEYAMKPVSKVTQGGDWGFLVDKTQDGAQTRQGAAYQFPRNQTRTRTLAADGQYGGWIRGHPGYETTNDRVLDGRFSRRSLGLDIREIGGVVGDDDEVLTWVSIYWFSRAGPTAAARM
ncbi:Alpha/Beta hydrolase protein [Roridomyces roridus]|uniref:Alpha/Beta hydrolase protein n=1 Tax=Roridomyces roridus TaxID=1738132 RepID=A0AAD7B999_9AGAR|nr:Alpha/Beta hydrolase protein [Roridomyces roridus]